MSKHWMCYLSMYREELFLNSREFKNGFLKHFFLFYNPTAAYIPSEAVLWRCSLKTQLRKNSPNYENTRDEICFFRKNSDLKAVAGKFEILQMRDINYIIYFKSF